MPFAKEYNEHLQREINIDVESLLKAVHEVAGPDVHAHTSHEHAHIVTAEGNQYITYGALAEAYHLDIRNFAVTEVNR
jgi:hypothetical protein